MAVTAASEARVLVRVKRRRDEEPLPEIVVEAPPASSKRSRADAAAAALRLVDSVPSGGWPSEDGGGLPLSWFRAAADATWGPAARDRQEQLPPAAFAPQAACGSSLREARRQVVAGALGEPVHLIDVEQRSMQVDRPRPPPQVVAPSIFTLDGQEMVATPAQAAVAPAVAPGWGGGGGGFLHGMDDEEDDMGGDFVWDVYALSGGPPFASSSLGGASVRLSAPVFDLDEDALEDLDDIDDSQSDDGSWQDRRGVSGSSSGGEFEDAAERPWVDALD